MHRSFVYLGSSFTFHFPLTVNIIRAWDYPQNRRVSGQRLCLLILQISISADRDVLAFFESGDIFPFPILKKRQRNVRCKVEELLYVRNFFKPPDKRSKIVRGMVKVKPIHPSRPSNTVFQNRKEKTL